MTEVFLKLFNMSFTAGFLILVVLFIRMLLKKAPRWSICLLWGLVAVRLVCPVSIESMLSLIPSAELIPAEIVYVNSTQMQSGAESLDNTINVILSERATGEKYTDNIAVIDGKEASGNYESSNTSLTGNSMIASNPTIAPGSLYTMITMGSILWIIGLIAMLLYAGTSFRLLYRRVQASISMADNIYICDDIASPFILGIFRPRIYLPSGMEESNSKYVIAHERAHLKRLDHLWKPFGFLLLSIHWFNPLVWVAYVMLCRDIEFACDEKVIKNMGMEEKKKYSMALVSGSVSRKMITACPVAFGETGVKERVKSVLYYKKPTLWVMLALTLLLLGVLIFFMTNPVGEDAANTKLQEQIGEDTQKESDETAEEQPQVTSAPRFFQMLTDKYRDLTTLNDSNVQPTDITFDDRHFVCEGEVHNTLEEMVYDLYYCELEGSYDRIENLIGPNESLQIAWKNTQKSFEDDVYMSEYRIHELKTLTPEEVQKLSESSKNNLCESIEAYGLTEYALVMLDISWRYNEKYLNLSPQLEEGRYRRYYLLGESEELPVYRIYELYWGEYFAPEEISEAEATIEQVMDRILSVTPLEKAIPLTTTADLPTGDQLYFLDETEDGIYSLYGFHSDEYGYTGLLINYKTDGEDNWNYLYDITNWIGYEFPKIAKTEEGGLLLTYCYSGGSGSHVDKMLYFKVYETGTLEGFEFTAEMIEKQTRALVSFELNQETEEVRIFATEGASQKLLGTIPYAAALNGQELQIEKADFDYTRLRFLEENGRMTVGVGLYSRDTLQPLYIGEIAFSVKAETGDYNIKFTLRDVTPYSNYGDLEVNLEDGVNSAAEAVALVQKQMIVAYENKFGHYEPLDVAPKGDGIYLGDEAMLAYKIPRLAVTEETKEYYVIPVVWDFRVYKDGKISCTA